MFTYTRQMKVYGPIMIPHQSCGLTKIQQDRIQSQSGIFVEVSEEWGIWEGQRVPDNAGMLWP